MSESEGELLVNRVMVVILSCRTMAQLNNSVSYADIAYRRLAETIGLIHRIQWVQKIERAIGFAHCQIKVVQDAPV